MAAVGVNLPCLLTPSQAMGSCRQAASSQTQPGSEQDGSAKTRHSNFLCSQ